jgi:hypothetical protein
VGDVTIATQLSDHADWMVFQNEGTKIATTYTLLRGLHFFVLKLSSRETGMFRTSSVL